MRVNVKWLGLWSRSKANTNIILPLTLVFRSLPQKVVCATANCRSSWAWTLAAHLRRHGPESTCFVGQGLICILTQWSQFHSAAYSWLQGRNATQDGDCRTAVERWRKVRIRAHQNTRISRTVPPVSWWSFLSWHSGSPLVIPSASWRHFLCDNPQFTHGT